MSAHSVELLPPPGPPVRDLPSSLDFDRSAHPSIPPIFFDAIRIRFVVFVEEQHCSAEEEIDQDDPISWHWVVYPNAPQKVAAGTIRLVPVSPLPQHGEGDGELLEVIHEKHEHDAKKAIGPRHGKTEMWDGKEPFVKLGRMATLKEYRKLGLGRLLVNTALEWLEKNPEKVTGEVDEDVESGQKKGLIGKWNGLVLVHAQKEVERFYGSCGFVKDVGRGEWWEEGIEHVAMWKRVKAS